MTTLKPTEVVETLYTIYEESLLEGYPTVFQSKLSIFKDRIKKLLYQENDYGSIEISPYYTRVGNIELGAGWWWGKTGSVLTSVAISLAG